MLREGRGGTADAPHLRRHTFHGARLLAGRVPRQGVHHACVFILSNTPPSPHKKNLLLFQSHFSNENTDSFIHSFAFCWQRSKQRDLEQREVREVCYRHELVRGWLRIYQINCVWLCIEPTAVPTHLRSRNADASLFLNFIDIDPGVFRAFTGVHDCNKNDQHPANLTEFTSRTKNITTCDMNLPKASTENSQLDNVNRLCLPLRYIPGPIINNEPNDTTS